MREKIAHRVVIIGGQWHALAEGRGLWNDWRVTPFGPMSGAVLNANWVEALLDRRISPAMPEWLAQCLEIFAAVLVAMILGLEISRWRQLGLSTILALLMIFISYVSAQNFGIFFDFFLPAVLVALHFGYERVREWHGKAAELDLRVAAEAAASQPAGNKLGFLETNENGGQRTHS